MPENEILSLIEKLLSGSATVEEEQRLLNWYHSYDHDEIEVHLESEKELDAIKQRLHQKLQQHISDTRQAEIEPLSERFFRKRKTYRWVAAASVILLLGAGSYFLFFNKTPETIAGIKAIQPVNDIQPGSDGAILTLADGRKIVLDSVKGNITNEAGVTVVNKEGSISYASAVTADAKTQALYNTISTPKGRQYQLTLEDGSKVWLNSASSIRFPIAFTGKERTVEITGEAYFEVTKNQNKPFVVSEQGQEIIVLGTHFNVNAYSDEVSVRTTLLEGSVKITTATSNQLIRPGEQSVVSNNRITVQHVDVSDAVAWKNGFFSFRGTDVKGIMRQLSRWYDVEVKYEGVNPSETFTGKIDRNLNLSEVLNILGKTKVRYRIEEGRKLVILP